MDESRLASVVSAVTLVAVMALATYYIVYQNQTAIANVSSQVASLANRPPITVTTSQVTVTTTTAVVTSTVTTYQRITRSRGPVAIFPRSYLPSCTSNGPTAAATYNSTFLVTRVDNYTLTNIGQWHTNLDAVYQNIIQSQTFANAVEGRFWVVASWAYALFGSRPAVQSLVILLNSDGSVYGYLWPLYFYFDDSSVHLTLTNLLVSSCPAQQP